MIGDFRVVLIYALDDIFEHVPGFLTGFRHHEGHVCGQALFDQRACDARIVRRQHARAGLEDQPAGAGLGDFGFMRRRQHVAHDALDIQHLREPRAVHIAVDVRETRDRAVA